MSGSTFFKYDQIFNRKVGLTDRPILSTVLLQSIKFKKLKTDFRKPFVKMFSNIFIVSIYKLKNMFGANSVKIESVILVATVLTLAKLRTLFVTIQTQIHTQIVF